MSLLTRYASSLCVVSCVAYRESCCCVHVQHTGWRRLIGSPYIYIVRDTLHMCVTNSCCVHVQHTGWRRLIGSPKSQIVFHKKTTKYRSILRKMTNTDKGSYESSLPCSIQRVLLLCTCATYTSAHMIYIPVYIYTYIYIVRGTLHMCVTNSCCVHVQHMSFLT